MFLPCSVETVGTAGSVHGTTVLYVGLVGGAADGTAGVSAGACGSAGAGAGAALLWAVWGVGAGASLGHCVDVKGTACAQSVLYSASGPV